MNLRRLFDHDDALLVGNPCGQRIQQRRLAGARAAGNQHVLVVRNGLDERGRHGRREGAEVDEIVETVATRELADREGRSADRARREHGRHARPILQPRIKNRLHL